MDDSEEEYVDHASKHPCIVSPLLYSELATGFYIMVSPLPVPNGVMPNGGVGNFADRELV